MSSWGRCQDALDDLYSSEDSVGTVYDGPAKQAGITYAQWQQVQEAIIEAVYPIAYTEGQRAEARRSNGGCPPGCMCTRHIVNMSRVDFNTVEPSTGDQP